MYADLVRYVIRNVFVLTNFLKIEKVLTNPKAISIIRAECDESRTKGHTTTGVVFRAAFFRRY